MKYVRGGAQLLSVWSRASGVWGWEQEADSSAYEAERQKPSAPGAEHQKLSVRGRAPGAWLSWASEEPIVSVRSRASRAERNKLTVGVWAWAPEAEHLWGWERQGFSSWVVGAERPGLSAGSWASASGAEHQKLSVRSWASKA